MSSVMPVRPGQRRRHHGASSEPKRATARARSAVSHRADQSLRAAHPLPETVLLSARLTLAELLTGWLANAEHVNAPDTLDGCDDYCRQLEAHHRIRSAASALCETLRQRVSMLVDAECHDSTRVLNRLTPPG